MIIVMQPGAPEQAVEQAAGQLTAAGFAVHRSSGATQTVLGAVGRVREGDVERLRELAFVADVVRVSRATAAAPFAAPVLGEVLVVGCGLMGGSLVRALADRRAAARLVVVDRAEPPPAALSLVDGALLAGSAEAERAIERADLVVLAMPTFAIADALPSVLDRVRADAAVTDLGSVKSTIVARAAGHPRAARFVGGHPMAGREQGGFEASTPTLFEGARWFLVPGADADAHASVERLVRAAGAEPVALDAARHDAAVARVSHLPQLVASALVALAADAGALDAAGPGFRDLTRVAGGPEAVWRDIFAANHAEIADAVRTLARALDGVADDLAAGSAVASLDLLARARAARAGR